MSNAPQVFSPVTPDQFALIVQKAHAAGIDLDGNKGTASKFGVEVSWDYSPATQVLTLQCLSTPFFISPESVNAKIQALAKDAMA